MDILFLMFVVAVFIAVILMVEGIYVTWNSTRGPAARRIAQRLQAMAIDGRPAQMTVSIRKQRLLSRNTGMQRTLLAIPVARRLDRMLQQAGAEVEVDRFLFISTIFGLCGLVIGLMLPLPAFLALWLMVIGAALPLLYVLRQRRKRLARLEEQLPDALDLMSRALRAGHALPAAIDMVGSEMADPIASEFRTVFDEVNFGVSIQDALGGLASRVPSNDIGYFVVAVLIQRDTGGNLTELLENIAQIVRDRLKLYGQVRALSAEGRLSAWILGLLPFVLTGIMMLINAELMKVLWTDPVGLKMVGGMLALMAAGILWMRKLIRIRV